MKYALLLALALIAFTACGPGAASNSTSTSTANQKRYDLRGKVVSIDKVAKKARIDHEDIPGYMEKMTMDFPIHEDWVWEELQPGAEIRAELVVDSTAKDPYWLEKIGIVASAKPGQDLPPVGENNAQVGSLVPDFSLTNQDGKKISTKGFAGKVYAITFIYARCPLADYCIKMSTNFSDAATLINKDSELKDKLALLSISFDPENDTPAKLKSYGLGYMGKGATELGVWQLAVGEDKEVRKIANFFGLRYEVDAEDKTQINHSLRTAVISPDGKVTKVFSGNDWEAGQLLSEMKASLK